MSVVLIVQPAERSRPVHAQWPGHTRAFIYTHVWERGPVKGGKQMGDASPAGGGGPASAMWALCVWPLLSDSSVTWAPRRSQRTGCLVSVCPCSATIAPVDRSQGSSLRAGSRPPSAPVNNALSVSWRTEPHPLKSWQVGNGPCSAHGPDPVPAPGRWPCPGIRSPWASLWRASEAITLPSLGLPARPSPHQPLWATSKGPSKSPSLCGLHPVFRGFDPDLKELPVCAPAAQDTSHKSLFSQCEPRHTALCAPSKVLTAVPSLAAPPRRSLHQLLPTCLACSARGASVHLTSVEGLGPTQAPARSLCYWPHR